MHKPESNEPSGIRLMRLINTRSRQIALQEAKNNCRICLYGTGGYWTAFEHSAYFLSLHFPKSEAFVLPSHPNYPFPIVGGTISDKELKKLSRSCFILNRKDDYCELQMDEAQLQGYSDWHNAKVKYFTDAIIS